MAGTLEVRIRGLREVQRALDRLARDGRKELLAGQRTLARNLARDVKAAGRASSKQAARAASTVRALTAGGNIGVRVGPHPLLYLSEFGMNRRTGWYAKPRYGHSPERQARPHVQGSYWFFATIDARRGEVTDKSRNIADRIIASWSA